MAPLVRAEPRSGRSDRSLPIAVSPFVLGAATFIVLGVLSWLDASAYIPVGDGMTDGVGAWGLASYGATGSVRHISGIEELLECVPGETANGQSHGNGSRHGDGGVRPAGPTVRCQ